MYNYRIRCVAIATFLLVFLPIAVQAEDNTVTTLFITANRYPTEIDEVGSSITVIDEQEIEVKNQSSVLELLRSVPGLNVLQSGGRGKTTSILIRGAEADQTLVLIDGIRANENTTDQFDFATLKAENIERIEVLRGPQSVLYGSAAIGGVINIITKKAERGLGVATSLEGGSHGSEQYKSTLSWSSERAHAITTVSYLAEDGISAAAGDRGNIEDDSYENFSLSSRHGVQFLDDGNGDLTLRFSSARSEVDGFEFGIGAIDDPNFVQKNDTLTLSLNLTKPLTTWLTPSITLGYVDQDLKGNDPDTEFNNFSIDNRTQSLVPKLDFYPSWGGVLTLGYSFENREGKNRGSFDERRDIHAFFLQKQISWDERFFVTAGMRHDDDSDFGEETTFRLTTAFLLSGSATRFHASYGTGFKAPTFNELFFPNFGNRDLDAETSWGYDIGVEQSFLDERATVDITFFQNKIDDLITFDTDTFLAANIDRADILGIESTLRLLVGDRSEVKVAYTYTDSEDNADGRILPRRARHRGSITAFLTPLEGLQSAVTLLLVNSRRETDGEKMDNYERVDLSCSYTISDQIKPFIRIKNLFDEEYEEIVGFGTLGFSVYAGVEVAFKGA